MQEVQREARLKRKLILKDKENTKRSTIEGNSSGGSNDVHFQSVSSNITNSINTDSLEYTNRIRLQRDARLNRKTMLFQKRHGASTSNSNLDTKQLEVCIAEKGRHLRQRKTFLKELAINLSKIFEEVEDITENTTILDDSVQIEYSAIFDVAENTVFDVIDIGDPEFFCRHCDAMMWYEERSEKSKTGSNIEFSICCPLQFIVSGQNYHRIGSLVPIEGQRPKFAQLYIYDTENEVSNRIEIFSSRTTNNNIDQSLVLDLKDMIDQHNVLAHTFRIVRNYLNQGDIANIRLRLYRKRSKDARFYNLPSSNEVAALIYPMMFPTVKMATKKTFLCENLIGLMKIERDSMLTYYRNNQTKVRSDIYKGIQDAVVRGETRASKAGKHIILPTSFTGGMRYMFNNCQDAMAICKKYGYPDLFITMTCNLSWQEIGRVNNPKNLKVEDRPDISCRVFKIKLDMIISDLKQGIPFGVLDAGMYTVEFQKRGLPHAHILLWLSGDHKITTTTQIDQLISSELPDPVRHPKLFRVVSTYMIHGPCGRAFSKSPCMKDGYCTKYYPKTFSRTTVIDDSGYPSYRRRDTGAVTEKKGVHMDNRNVVPYNAYLLMSYQAHVNVEYCNKSNAIKYLFKYVNKGPDRVAVGVTKEASSGEDAQVIDQTIL
ncbi:uncharacterized protein [Arachis hypogaea]|uniref:uncharacterized protein n=1 Tax=Arachis hypogaea TaxID=3818 RepID=UPI003B21FFCB